MTASIPPNFKNSLSPIAHPGSHPNTAETLPHTCAHCSNIVVDPAVESQGSLEYVLEYSSVAELLAASQQCLFIRHTIAELDDFLIASNLRWNQLWQT
jgi:hypothetical protein